MNEKRGRGRPPKPEEERLVPFTVYVLPEDLRFLDALAAATQNSRGDITRAALSQLREQVESQVEGLDEFIQMADKIAGDLSQLGILPKPESIE